MMTPGAIRVLQELAADDGCDLIRDGIHAYCGSRPIASRVVSELAWLAAVHPVAPHEGAAKYYEITNMGRAYLRRPELAEEYQEAVNLRKGPFTIIDDRIVPLSEPALKRQSGEG